MDMYFIALLLPQSLNIKIKVYKEWMKERWNCNVGLKSPAHITIIPPFWMKPEAQNTLIAATGLVSQQQSLFTVRTDDFDAFKPRTLFIAVSPNQTLNNLKKAADAVYVTYSELGIKKELRPFHPHITIATRDLHKAAFYEAWAHLNEKSFKEEWTAAGLSILRHNKKTWDVLHTSPFLK